MYKVIKFFVDLQDNNHPYKPGDTFPREGKEVTAERLAELAGDKNKQGCPLIVAEAAEGKSIDKMTIAELQAYAKEKEIDLAGATAKADILAKIKEAEAAE